MEILRIFDLLQYSKQKYQKEVAIAGKENGKWITYSSEEYCEQVNSISYGFLKLGIKPKDKIATITNNRPEWNFIDMAALQIGAIHVPIYPTISQSDYRYILNHAEVKLIFVAGEEMYRKISEILPEIPSIIEMYTFQTFKDIPSLSSLVELGRANSVAEQLDDLKRDVSPEDVATIIYTSGTTGFPKGVMLSHQNLISNFKAVSHIPPIGSEGKALSFLPTCHVYERMLNYMYHFLGISIYYAESLGTIGDNIREIKPDILTTVPRLLEKIYDKIYSKGKDLKGIKKSIFFWALGLATNFELYGKKSIWYYLKLKIADKLVLSKWREALGGNIKVIVSGGASLQPRLNRIFWAARIPILEGYGLTETSPVISVCTFEKNEVKFGSVGPILNGVKVKIANDGEILCKGPNVMIGYYKDQNATKDVIDDEGWFHTGDLGFIDNQNLLTITGRKKSLFKTSFGKYINPQIIEEKFKESYFIENIMVVGENQKFAAALIVPDFGHLKIWCQGKAIEWSDEKEMINKKEVKDRYKKEVTKYNAFFGQTEKITRFELLPNEWTVETKELTPTLKLKRRVIIEKYKDIIDRLFS